MVESSTKSIREGADFEADSVVFDELEGLLLLVLDLPNDMPLIVFLNSSNYSRYSRKSSYAGSVSSITSSPSTASISSKITSEGGGFFGWVKEESDILTVGLRSSFDLVLFFLGLGFSGLGGELPALFEVELPWLASTDF